MTEPVESAGSPGAMRSWIRRPVDGDVDGPAGALPTDGDQVHASTLVELPDGRLVAGWFRGPHEGAPRTRIEWSVGSERDWSAPVAIQPEPGVACWNPVLGTGPDGDVYLFFRSGERISQWRSYRCWWTGTGFSTPERVFAPGDGGPVKNPPVVLPRGRWLAGGSVEDWAQPPRWDAHVDASIDGGRTWTRSPIPIDHAAMVGAGVIQPTLWRTAGGDVVALMRSTAGAVFRSTSADGGRSWSEAVPIPVPNNNSGICAAALGDGRVVLAHNPVDDPWGRRCPLVLSVSEDDGRTFATVAIVEDGHAPLDGITPRNYATGPEGYRPADSGVVTTGAGEYSYPTVLVSARPGSPGTTGTAVLVSYTWQRRGIALARTVV